MRPPRELSIVAAITIILAGNVAPADADGRRKSVRRPPVNQISWNHHVPRYEYCRVGWWQTLKYGKVRPRWAMLCRTYW